MFCLRGGNDRKVPDHHQRGTNGKIYDSAKEQLAFWVEAAGGTLTGGGAVQPSLTVDSGGTFDPNATAWTFQDIDVIEAKVGFKF